MTPTYRRRGTQVSTRVPAPEPVKPPPPPLWQLMAEQYPVDRNARNRGVGRAGVSVAQAVREARREVQDWRRILAVSEGEKNLGNVQDLPGETGVLEHSAA